MTNTLYIAAATYPLREVAVKCFYGNCLSSVQTTTDCSLSAEINENKCHKIQKITITSLRSNESVDVRTITDQID